MATKTQKLLKSLKSRPEVKTPIATDMFLPNHSGVQNHRDLKDNFVNITGDTMTGKLRVEDNIELTANISGDNTVEYNVPTGETHKFKVNNVTIASVNAVALNMNTHKITGVVDPIADQDAATKKYVDDSIPKITKHIYIENPTATDCYPVAFTEEAATITNITAETDTGTVAFNIEERAHGSAEDSGTNVMTADLVADDDGVTTTTFSNAGIAAASWMTLESSAITGSPTKLWVAVSYTVD